MRIFRSLDDVQRDNNCILTTGTFDGVHLGHQSIIKTLHSSVSHQNECVTIVTFEPHPQFVVKSHKRNDLRLLTTIDEKISLFQDLKIDRLIIIHFDEKFAQLSSQQFIENILVKKVGLNKIIIGHDHAFGKDRQGNFEILERLSRKYNYSIDVLPPFSLDGVIISSTKIRNLLLSGDVEHGAKYLGRNYRLAGTVIQGEGRGHTLNIPTANIKPFSNEKLIPADGIYAVWVGLGNQKFKAVLYIGLKPTFAFNDRTIELHIFNFCGDLYGQTLEIEFKAKIRDDYHFDKIEKLIEQIENDKKRTLEILAND
ncbi:MAG: bifunctional riboflavin kinase/FAD synthetase [bacterium]|nr:MAG: bifunctional riboflavin kinase/FAD synthetase [bacterium]